MSEIVAYRYRYKDALTWVHSTTEPARHPNLIVEPLCVATKVPCGIADPSARDCKNMKEVGGGMDGERYRCDVCGKGYFLDYEEMK